MVAHQEEIAPKRRRGAKKSKKNDHSQPETEEVNAFSNNSSAASLSYKAHDALLIKLSTSQDGDSQTWHEYEKLLQTAEDKKENSSNVPTIMSDKLAATYRSLADDIYRREVQLYGSKGGGGDGKWVEGTIRKGTLKDRIAAMSVIVSKDPVHKFHAIDGLLQMTGGATQEGVGQTNSRVAQLAAEALEDLFLNTLLPSNRKLCTLNQRQLPVLEATKNGNAALAMSPRILLLWRFEEMVKEKYNIFIRNYLGKTLREGLELTKVAALRTASSLLRAVPEGESAILGMLANKLGDPAKKTAAAAGHEMRRVLQEHPNMQVVIAREVQQLAHRPHLSSRALYNCVTFLNQLKLVRPEKVKKGEVAPPGNDLPTELIGTYFKLFKVSVQNVNASDRRASADSGEKTRLLSALLAGVNRAHPYLPEKDQNLDEHIDELYRVVHTAPPATATQALSLLFHITMGSQTESRGSEHATSEEAVRRQDRYYRALFAALSTPTLISQGKHTTMFFNLMYKSLKADKHSGRVQAIAKRMLATTLHCNSSAFAASIFVLNEVASSHEELRAYLEDIPDETLTDVVIDPSKREPRVAFAVYKDESDRAAPQKASSWELALASHHYHPSVAKFASTVGDITYSGNPLQDFSLTPFLDKFAYKNPKDIKRVAQQVKRGESVGERRSLRAEDIGSRLSLPVNDPSFLKQSDTAVQDQFFRTFFAERAKRAGADGSTKKNEIIDEDTALDNAEGAAVDHSFNTYEKQWESDSDEEDFVDGLALKMLEDTADGAPVDVDDDPDMDDWGNLSGDGGDNAGDDGQDSAEDENPIAEPAGRSDDDAFMDNEGSSDDSDDDDDESDADVQASTPGTKRKGSAGTGPGKKTKVGRTQHR